MSKGEGRNIIIKFTDDLVGDVSDNINAFTVTGKEYQWVDGPDNNGPLLDKEYVIDKVERYGTPPLWSGVFEQGVHTNTRAIDEALTLKLPETKLIAVEDSFTRQNSPTSVNEVQYAPLIGSIIGNWISPVIQSSGQYRVRWQEDKPAGTDITIEYTTGQIQGTWIEILNGDVITSDTNLWLRVTLETTDTSVTPTLQDLWIEEPDAPQDKIRIVMDDFSRFPTVEGNLTVEYDASVGNLAGRGGPVESFTEEFTPTGLVQKPNPGPAENFKMTAAAAVDFIKIEYNNRYTAENFKITAAATITLTFVEVVNP